MNPHLHRDPSQSPSLPDLNAVSVTGLCLHPPDLLAGMTGELVAIALIAIEGKRQPSTWGTLERQTYVVHAWALGSLAERMATLEAGTRLRILGSMDYLYRAGAKSPTEHAILAIRIEELAVLP
ncbi:MAG TPA: hypothetical protein PK614_00570 [Nitrospira sp.]|nr:hypothetical protein [Nitrospira sp.]